MPDVFDIIIIGSGPAGTSAAFPCLNVGARVLMLDGGKKPILPAPQQDILATRANDATQWQWMIGEDYHALRAQEASSPKLRVPAHKFAFAEFHEKNHIHSENFLTLGSLAAGGLSNIWGCGVARWSGEELHTFPFFLKELNRSYETVTKRMGVSGKSEDDLADFFGVDSWSQPPLAMDNIHEFLLSRYNHRRDVLVEHGWRMGRSRVAVISEDIEKRKACNYSGNCLWGCYRDAMYSASQELPALQQYPNFNYSSGYIVQKIQRDGDYYHVMGIEEISGQAFTLKASNVLLAAGTLATTRLALDALNYRQAVPLLSCPTAAFLLWIPRLLGNAPMPGFGLGQLSFAFTSRMAVAKGTRKAGVFGSTFSVTGIPLWEFVRHVPMRRRYSLALLKQLLSSCVAGNVFLPGHLTNAQAQLEKDNSLRIVGCHAMEVSRLMAISSRTIRRAFRQLGAYMLPGSFTIGKPGSDVHYAGTLPMREEPNIAETNKYGELKGLEGVYVVDGASLPYLSEKSHTLTIMANADRIGKAIARKFSS